MFKKVGMPLLTTTLVVGVLAGCGSNKEEFAKGIELYNEGSFESLVESQEFFIDYIEKNGNNKGAENWLKNINKDILKQAKTLTDKAYAAQDFEAALEYVEVGLSIAPTDKDFKSAHTLVSDALKEQNLFNEYADYLEEIYVYIKERLNSWEALIKSAKTGQTSIATLKHSASNLYIEMTQLREKINNKTFELTDSDTIFYKQVNLELFNYVTSIEDELSNVFSKNDISSVDVLIGSMNDFTVTDFAQQFSNIADDMLAYTTETNYEGEQLRNIKYTLNFAKAYEESLKQKTGVSSEERTE